MEETAGNPASVTQGDNGNWNWDLLRGRARYYSVLEGAYRKVVQFDFI